MQARIGRRGRGGGTNIDGGVEVAGEIDFQGELASGSGEEAGPLEGVVEDDCVGGGDEGSAADPKLAEGGFFVGGFVDAVDLSLEREVVEVEGIGDVEVEGLVPEWVEVFLFDGGAEFLAVEDEFHGGVG